MRYINGINDESFIGYFHGSGSEYRTYKTTGLYFSNYAHSTGYFKKEYSGIYDAGTLLSTEP